MSNIEFIVEIREYPGYFISTKGRIFSEKVGNEMKELKVFDNTHGYLKVNLYKEGKSYNKSIHRLVGETFLERVEGKNEIDHYNRIRDDNRLENLHWVNRRENIINTIITSRNTSGKKGVIFHTTLNKWVGSIQVEKNTRKNKYFKTKEEAIKWRLEMEKKYYK